MSKTESKGWSPYIAGALTGLLIIAVAWIEKRYFGASTCFVRAAGYIEQIFSPERVAGMDYFSIFKPKIDFQVMMVLGLLVGAFISSITDGSFRIKHVPDMWASRFGTDPVKRGIVAFVGGVILLFGARLAGGCPSGHGLGGMSQMAVSGLVVLLCFFAGGIAVTKLITYRGGDSK